MSKLTGYSLSRCVNDIAAGHVAYNDVEKIIARTAIVTQEELHEVFSHYKISAWMDHPERAEEIAERLFVAGKIEQPRLKSEDCPQLPGEEFHWTDETGEIFTTLEINEAATRLEEDRNAHASILAPMRKPGETNQPEAQKGFAISLG